MTYRGRMNGLGLGVGVAALVAGCTIPTAAETGRPEVFNTCTVDPDCSGGLCVDGACRSVAGSIGQVWLEILGPSAASAARYSGMQLALPLGDLSPSGGNMDILLPPAIAIEGTVLPPPCIALEPGAGPVERNAAGGCPADTAPVPLPLCRTPAGGAVARDSSGACPDGSHTALCHYDFAQVPLRLSFVPKGFPVGLGGVSLASTVSVTDPVGAPGVGSFKLVVPPGQYDVHVAPVSSVPLNPESEVCPISPQVLSLEVKAVGDEAAPSLSVRAKLTLAPHAVLRAAVEWPSVDPGKRMTLRWEPNTLNAWRFSVISPTDGSLVSAEYVLSNSIIGENGAEKFHVEIPFSPTSDRTGQAGHELIRLRPPAAQPLAPTFLIERSALELVPGAESVINHIVAIPATVDVAGGLLASTDPSSTDPQVEVAGSVTLVAKSLAGLQPGTLAYFQTTVDTIENQDGGGPYFRATVLPGEYRVRADPSLACPEIRSCADGVALCECPVVAGDVSWEVSSATYQAGKTIPLRWGTPLLGTVLGPGRQALRGAALRVDPAPSVGSIPTLLEEPLNAKSSPARSHATAVRSDGDYELYVESGVYDLAVRPTPGSGFPWLVQAGVSADEASLGASELRVSQPVAYTGTLRVPGDLVLVNATIRAYAWVGEPNGPMSRVVQVAESLSDQKNGRFTLLLPERLIQN